MIFISVMPTHIIIILVIVFLIMFVSYLIFLIKKFKEYNIIKNVPTSKIRSLALGLAEVFGKAKGTTISTPISKVDCIFYRLVVKKLHRNKKSSSWRTIKIENSNNSFFIEDSTGQVEIVPSKASFYLHLKKLFYRTVSGFNLINNVLDINNVNDLESLPVVNNKEKISFRFSRSGDLKYYEYYIEPNDEIYVLGTVSNKDNSSNLFIHKGVRDKFFVIGSGSENNLLKTLRLKMYLYIGIGVFAIFIGLISFWPLILAFLGVS